MKKELLKEVKKLLDNEGLTKEELLLGLFRDDNDNLNLSGLDFSNFEGDVIIGDMKIKGNLFQYWQEVEGDLYQSYQKVGGNYYSTDVRVKGRILFEEPSKILKKVTSEELKKMGYELEE